MNHQWIFGFPSTLWLCQNSELENDPVEIVDLPSYKMVMFHSFLYVYQRVSSDLSEVYPTLFSGDGLKSWEWKHAILGMAHQKPDEVTYFLGHSTFLDSNPYSVQKCGFVHGLSSREKHGEADADLIEYFGMWYEVQDHGHFEVGKQTWYIILHVIAIDSKGIWLKLVYFKFISKDLVARLRERSSCISL